METTSILSSSLVSFHLLPGNPKNGFCDRKRASARAFASRREANDQNYGGRLVDEGMIVLRRRMHEMKKIERNYEPPSEWMDWEKRLYTSYDSLICEVMGLLQILLMNTRPALGLGILALVILSVPASTAMVLFHLMGITKGVFAGIHLN